MNAYTFGYAASVIACSFHDKLAQSGLLEALTAGEHGI